MREHLRVADFDFELPEELIAQQPPAERGTSRMLVMDRATGALRDDDFSRISGSISAARRPAGPQRQPRDSRAPLRAPHAAPRARKAHRPHRSHAHRAGRRKPVARPRARPGRKVAIGERLVFPAPTGEIVLEAEVLERGEFGERLLRVRRRSTIFLPSSTASATCRCRPTFIATMPTPIASATRPSSRASAARWPRPPPACTSRRRFSKRSRRSGVEIARVTLHVGLGTFAPLRVERVDEVRLHRERYTLSRRSR